MGVLFMIVMVSAFTGCLAQSCDPIQDCNNGNVTDLVADPRSCSKYYVCVSVNDEVVPSDVSFDCDEGEYFDADVGDCVTLVGDTCYNPCANHCDMVCDATTNGSRVAFPGMADRYNLCVGGTPIETACPDDLQYFNGVDCVADPDEACDFCSPHCSTVGAQVADPNNCRRYYICSDLGNPDWNLHGVCPLRTEHFSATSGKCVLGTSCTANC